MQDWIDIGRHIHVERETIIYIYIYMNINIHRERDYVLLYYVKYFQSMQLQIYRAVVTKKEVGATVLTTSCSRPDPHVQASGAIGINQIRYT